MRTKWEDREVEDCLSMTVQVDVAVAGFNLDGDLFFKATADFEDGVITRPGYGETRDRAIGLALQAMADKLLKRKGVGCDMYNRTDELLGRVGHEG